LFLGRDFGIIGFKVGSECFSAFPVNSEHPSPFLKDAHLFVV
jgi:hypothetical protein